MVKGAYLSGFGSQTGSASVPTFYPPTLCYGKCQGSLIKQVAIVIIYSHPDY